ncbi:MAG TPA: sulfatase [Candidatus Sulfomarinibacteraceae bacterium]|nr:sulfatase [Candidatus Sulfomarinibacteraceae bacterium]
MTLPNILFITSHDLGRHLGCYGQQTVRSPHLDRLASSGVRFANSFCTAPQCSPSRAALHTGRHAHSVGVLGLVHDPFNWRLQPASAHLARRVKTLGYHTALFGSQHVTGPRHLSDLGYEHTVGEQAAPQLAQDARAYLASRDDERPFYLEVVFTEIHLPYDWGGAQPDDELGVALPPYIPHHPQSVAEFAALQGAIRQLDRGVGILLDALDELGLAENTLVLFAADHGLAVPRAKCTLYDPGIEAALLLRWPAAGVAGGRVLQPLVSHVDVAPTLAEALGLPAAPGDFHGRSFWPLLQGGDYEPRDAIFAEKTYHTAYEPLRAVRSATHKLIVNFETGPRFDVPDDVRNSRLYPLMVDQATGHRPYAELYDLQNDPHERHNLAGQPHLADVETTLRRRLHRWMQETADPLLSGAPRSPFYERALEMLSTEP